MQIDLGYYTLPVRDLARGKAFYGTAFGWTFEPDGGHVVDSSPPGGLSEGATKSARVYFRTDDIKSAIGRVREAGGEAAEAQEYPSGWSCDCRDDQGTEFSLWEPSAAYR
jgi:predicted enzyme related to lactoylglutathione lyase